MYMKCRNKYNAMQLQIPNQSILGVVVDGKYGTSSAENN